MSDDSDNSKNSIPPRPDAWASEIHPRPNAWASEVPEIKIAPGAPEIRVSGVPEIRVSGIPEISISGIPGMSISDIPGIQLSGVFESRSVMTATLSVTTSQVGSVETHDAPYEELDSLFETKKRLEAEEKQLELLEKASELERRRRKYKRSDPAETWASYWIASPIAYLTSRTQQEEWLGDLLETNREMLRKGYPRWMVNLNNVGKTLELIMSALQIKLSDFLPWGKRKSE